MVNQELNCAKPEPSQSEPLNESSADEHNSPQTGKSSYSKKSPKYVLKKDIIGIYNILDHYTIIKSVQAFAQPGVKSGCGESAGY